MKHFRSSLVLIIIALALSSCTAIYLGISKDRALKGALRLRDTVRNREVIVLNMMHLGTKPHYDEVRKYLDDRKAEGYVTFYEGVSRWDEKIDGPFDSLKCDTISRKFRRALGLYLTAYDDKENKSMSKYATIDAGLIGQDNDSLGLNTDRDYHTDFTQSELIKYYEARFDTIPLTAYDFETPLKEKYVAPENGQIDLRLLTKTLREENLTDAVIRMNHAKNIIVYGGAHRWTISATLYESGYEVFEPRFLIKEARKNKTKKAKR